MSESNYVVTSGVTTRATRPDPGLEGSPRLRRGLN